MKRPWRLRRRWTIALRGKYSGDQVELAWLTFRSQAEAERWIAGTSAQPSQLTEYVVIPPKRRR